MVAAAPPKPNTLAASRIEITGFAGLKYYVMDLRGNNALVSGPNGSGKTSALDALIAALKYRWLTRDEPIHNGADKATIKLDLMDRDTGEPFCTITRTITPGDSRLECRAADGSKITTKGQDFCDSLIGDGAVLNIGELVNERKGEEWIASLLRSCQVEAPVKRIKEITGEDIQALRGESAFRYCDRMAGKDGIFYGRRHDLGVKMRTAEAALSQERDRLGDMGGPLPNGEDTPSMASVMNRITKLEALVNARREALLEVERLANDYNSSLAGLHASRSKQADIERRAADVQEEIDKLIARKQDLLKQAANEQTNREKAEKELVSWKVDCLDVAKAEADAMPDKTKELEAARKEAADGEKTIKLHAAREESDKRVKQLSDEVDMLTKEHARIGLFIDTIRGEVQPNLLNGLDLGVDGLTVTDGEMRYHGVLIQECSLAERMVVGAAILSKRDPRLKIARYDGAEALDQEHMDYLIKLLNGRGYQVLLSEVSREAAKGEAPRLAIIEYVEAA